MISPGWLLKQDVSPKWTMVLEKPPLAGFLTSKGWIPTNHFLSSIHFSFCWTSRLRPFFRPSYPDLFFSTSKPCPQKVPKNHDHFGGCVFLGCVFLLGWGFQPFLRNRSASTVRQTVAQPHSLVLGSRSDGWGAMMDVGCRYPVWKFGTAIHLWGFNG